MFKKMFYYMPEMTYHERQPLLSVDLHPTSQNNCYRFATSSTQEEIRIWELELGSKKAEDEIGIAMISNLEGHLGSVNQVKFCPNPKFNLLASCDCRGNIFIWRMSTTASTRKPGVGMPANRENWLRIKVLYHESDVTCICWSPCGKYIASVSNDATLRVHEAETGKHRFILSQYRYFPSGVSYDPTGKYIITMSTDRKMDLICAAKGTLIHTFGKVQLPNISLGDLTLQKRSYLLFHDDLLTTFTRTSAFSPCGQLIVAPAGCLHIDNKKNHCSYVYKRKDVEELKSRSKALRSHPLAILPSSKPTFLIKFCPISYKLKDGDNYSGLPYRVVWLALTREEIIIYDSQHTHAIALFNDLTYHCLSDASWSNDGKIIIVSDMEEYVHYIKVDIVLIGDLFEKPCARTKKAASVTKRPSAIVLSPSCSSENLVNKRNKQAKKNNLHYNLSAPRTVHKNVIRKKRNWKGSKKTKRKGSKTSLKITNLSNKATIKDQNTTEKFTQAFDLKEKDSNCKEDKLLDLPDLKPRQTIPLIRRKSEELTNDRLLKHSKGNLHQSLQRSSSLNELRIRGSLKDITKV